jgi:chemotaxis protein MotB
MKKSCYLIIPVLLFVVLNSCAPVYKCGDAIPAKQPSGWGKRLKTVVNERDKLCTDLAVKEIENVGLKKNLADFRKNMKL